MMLSNCCYKKVVFDVSMICSECNQECTAVEVCDRCGVPRKTIRERQLICQDEKGVYDHHVYNIQDNE